MINFQSVQLYIISKFNLKLCITFKRVKNLIFYKPFYVNIVYKPFYVNIVYKPFYVKMK
jgi:hypothetical protein